jgi:hypothetical protein
MEPPPMQFPDRCMRAWRICSYQNCLLYGLQLNEFVTESKILLWYHAHCLALEMPIWDNFAHRDCHVIFKLPTIERAYSELRILIPRKELL